MPRNITLLKVFIASPSDVGAERELVTEIIQKLNVAWSDTLGIHLDPIMWETHSFPGVGDDAQAVINEQIADDYDIFVGILWKKFGTPTGRANSGTAEEYERAYERYKQDPDGIRIMFYFSNFPITLSEIDFEQASSVLSFRERLGEQGLYWWEYKDIEEFEKLVEMHLTRQVQGYGISWGTGKAKTQISEVETSVSAGMPIDDEFEELEDELGFLDFIEIGAEKFDTATEIMGIIASASKNLSSRMEEETDELNQLKEESAGLNQQKRVINRIAREMNEYSNLMEEKVPSLTGAYSDGIEGYVGAVQVLTDFTTSNQELVGVLKSAREMKATILELTDSVDTVVEIFSGWPRITKDINKAKRRITRILMKLVEELDSAINLTEEYEKMVEEFIIAEYGEGKTP